MGVEMKGRERGQAMMEFLPAMLVFATVLSSAFAFYKAVRWATIRQEVVRNLAMATIANSGTLTTPSELSDGSQNALKFGSNVVFTDRSLASTDLGNGGQGVLPVNSQNAISGSATCFRVYPARPGGGSQEPFAITGIFGAGANPEQNFEIMSRATIYRGALGANGFPLRCR